MVTRIETAITTLVVIAILVSASTVWYGMSIMSDVSKLTGSVADLAGSVADLTTSVADLATSVAEFKTTTAEDLADIADNLTAIKERVTKVEATLTPTITVVGPWSGAEMDAFLPILERFEALSGINVKYRVLRAEDLATLLPASFAAGTAPGDVIFMWAWWIAQQAQAGHVLEVTDLVDAANFLLGTFDQVNVTGKIYGGAYTGKVKPGFWYRKSTFQQWGLTPTTVNSTWAEFSTLLNNIAAKVPTGIPIASGDGVGWPLSDITEHFLITFGGAQLQYDLIAGTVAWNSTQVRTIFADKLVPTLGNFSTPTEWTTILTDWWNGYYGLYFMGSWITGMVANASDLGIIPLPGAEALVLPADYFFIPAYTKYPQEAKELFSFLISEEAQRLQVVVGGHLATNVNVPLDLYPPADRMVMEFLKDYAIAPDLDDTIGGEFQTTFWSQLQLLWADPTKLDDVLAALEAVAP